MDQNINGRDNSLKASHISFHNAHKIAQKDNLHSSLPPADPHCLAPYLKGRLKTSVEKITTSKPTHHYSIETLPLYN